MLFEASVVLGDDVARGSGSVNSRWRSAGRTMCGLSAIHVTAIRLIEPIAAIAMMTPRLNRIARGGRLRIANVSGSTFATVSVMTRAARRPSGSCARAQASCCAVKCAAAFDAISLPSKSVNDSATGNPFTCRMPLMKGAR